MSRPPQQMMRRALQLLSRKINPAHSPDLQPISLAELGCKAADLRRVPLGVMNLRGIDFGAAQMPDEAAAIAGSVFADCQLDLSRLEANFSPQQLSKLALPAQGNSLPWAGKAPLPASLPLHLSTPLRSGYSCVIQLADGRLCSAGRDGLRWWNLETGRCEQWQIQLSDETVLRLDAGGATLDNLVRPWRSVQRDGQRLAADAELGRHCGFLYNNRWPLQPWRFPERVEWIELPAWPGEYRRVRLKPAEGEDLQARLGHIHWHE